MAQEHRHLRLNRKKSEDPLGSSSPATSAFAAPVALTSRFLHEHPGNIGETREEGGGAWLRIPPRVPTGQTPWNH
jgi:hypothetical protein